MLSKRDCEKFTMDFYVIPVENGLINFGVEGSIKSKHMYNNTVYNICIWHACK